MCSGCFGRGKHGHHGFVVKSLVGDAWAAAPRNASYADYKCLPRADNFDTLGAKPAGWGMHVAERMAASPWHEEPRAAECYWPLDPDQLRVCSLPPALGGGHGDALHVCHDRPSPSTTRANATWCGADIDARGNFRFGGTGKADASFAGIGRPLDKASEWRPPPRVETVEGVYEMLRVAVKRNLANKISLADTFFRYDDDGSRQIDRGEFRVACRALGVNASAAIIASTFEAMDLDRSGTLDLKELQVALKVSKFAM